MQSRLTSFMGKKIWLALAVLVIVSVGVLMLLQPASNAVANSFWDVSVSSNTQDIDHSDWQKLLNRYLVSDHVSGVNRFDYQIVKNADKKLLDNYLNVLQQLDPRIYNRNSQQAYWINLYNALTVRVILDNYPVDSITGISDDFVSFGPWDDHAATIQGQELSLNAIEHGILRPLWNDNRIHYAVNCASIGCPNLSAQAFTAANREELLEQAARAYINHERGVRFENDELIVSSIYHWYRVDFGDTDASLLRHLKKYAEAPLLQQLENFQGDIDHDYDWNLNDL